MFEKLSALQTLPCLQASHADAASGSLPNVPDAGHPQAGSLDSRDGGGSEGIGSIKRLFADSELQTLSLAHGSLQTVTDGVGLAELLGAMQLLENLSLYGNSLFGLDAFHAFADAASHPMLRVLNLGECGLAGAESGRALGGLLQKLPQLQSLCLRKNHRLQNEGFLADFWLAVRSLSSWICNSLDNVRANSLTFSKSSEVNPCVMPMFLI